MGDEKTASQVEIGQDSPVDIMESTPHMPTTDDVKPGDIVWCFECNAFVPVTRVKNQSIWHFDVTGYHGGAAREMNCSLNRNRVMTKADIVEKFAADPMPIIEAIQSLEDRVRTLEDRNNDSGEKYPVPTYVGGQGSFMQKFR